MYTSIVLTVLAGVVAGRASTVEVAWSADYNSARQTVQTERKPLAVFLGSGENGYDKVCRDGALSKVAQEALHHNYVCVYVDMDSVSGKHLAEAFAITKPAGLVISDRGGDKQAFHHDGALSGAELTRALNRFADPKLAVRRTVTDLKAVARTSFYAPAHSPTNPAPGMNYAPPQFGGFQPSFGPSMGGFGGGGGGGACRT